VNPAQPNLFYYLNRAALAAICTAFFIIIPVVFKKFKGTVSQDFSKLRFAFALQKKEVRKSLFCSF
jgi:hypothetical protein